MSLFKLSYTKGLETYVDRLEREQLRQLHSLTVQYNFDFVKCCPHFPASESMGFRGGNPTFRYKWEEINGKKKCPPTQAPAGLVTTPAAVLQSASANEKGQPLRSSLPAAQSGPETPSDLARVDVGPADPLIRSVGKKHKKRLAAETGCDFEPPTKKPQKDEGNVLATVPAISSPNITSP